MKRGLEKHIDLAQLVDPIYQLKDTVPSFNSESHLTSLERYPALQEPLQIIFARYIEAHLELLEIAGMHLGDLHYAHAQQLLR